MEKSFRLTWIKAGAIAGLIATGSYSFLVLGSGSETMGFIAGSLFGLSLAVAAYGLYQFVSLQRRTPLVQGAVAATIIGSVVFVSMIAIQLSIRSDLPADLDQTGVEAALELTDRVHFGLDLVWDLYFAVGMSLFGIAALSHPRLGRVLGGSGVAIAAALLTLNVATFPTPPASAGSIDLGPAAGLWYLIVTVQMFRSLGWAASRIDAHTGV